ncbi:hypothetical protein CXQ85_002284 [Candidozyma haemuli]|uniref:Uncharacterized protein n=1 Tax=Candidozyma haemuli TaxID=45357 RepID=A0A2V1AT81_9ASCO|nr:hypothetical protein CXQ85_002284 [[Candida] haemuloni]PVH20493.1 hypothetical protein CXQ85_002284 [[Candida] haemuloni]
MLCRITRSRIARRSFSVSRFLSNSNNNGNGNNNNNNNNNKGNKDQLRKLGSVLSKGKVGESTDKETRKGTALNISTKNLPPPSTIDESALDLAVKENIDELEDSYETVAFMTKDDVQIQENLDSGGQFGSFPSKHFLDRKALIRSLPDEVDMLDTPWEEIERIYSTLNRLDEDKAVHAKYMKRFGIDEKDLMTKLRLGRNLDDMCKAGRRGEKYDVPKGLERVFKRLYPYNVVGFDRSILGVPLRTGKHSLKSDDDENARKQIPEELVRDVRPFDTKVPVHKIDVNFFEEDQLKESISPYDSKPLPPEDLLRNIGKPLIFDDIDNYKKIEHPSVELLDRIEREALTLKDSLYLEIARKMIPSGTDVVNLNAPKLRTNEYVVASKDHHATTLSGPTLSYRYKYFDLVPVYGMLLTNRKHCNNLYKHLFKVILINLEEHIDVLTRIKYKSPEESQAFLGKLYAKIHRVVSDKLMPMAVDSRLRISLDYQAVIHKHIASFNFSRLYWLKAPQKPPFGGRDYNRSVRRRAQKYNILILNPAHLKYSK